MREAVELFATFYSSPRPVDETIDLVGLARQARGKVGTLSGGQKRRADVAIGIIGDPDLIFLDEPTTGFDPTARRDAWNMIEGLKDLGKTVFLTTHYMDEAQHLADRVAILRGGEIVAQGRTEELGESLGRRTVIGFALSNGRLGVEEIRAQLGAPVEVAGNEVSIETEDPQADLYRLLALAEERGAELEDLEVRRPSLEDIFLELTREEERVSDRRIVLAQARMAIIVALRTPRGLVFTLALPAAPAPDHQLGRHRQQRRNREPAGRPEGERARLLHGGHDRLLGRALDLHDADRLADDAARARAAEALPGHADAALDLRRRPDHPGQRPGSPGRPP